jgi:hypothetical protein
LPVASPIHAANERDFHRLQDRLDRLRMRHGGYGCNEAEKAPAVPTLLPLDPFADVCQAAIRPAAPGLVDATRRAHGRVVTVAGRQRSAERFNVAATIVARPVDADGSPTGEAFEAVVSDLSRGGLRLLHSRYLPTTHLAVRMPVDRAVTVSTLIMLVTRVIAVGCHYEYAGPFVARCEPGHEDPRR